MKQIPLIFISVILNTIAQVGLKNGMRMIGYFEFSMGNIYPITIQLIQNPYIVISTLIYVLSLFIWLMVLSRVDLSFAYPLTSLGYIFTAIIGYAFLNEGLSITRFVGILIIIIGVYLVAKS